MCFSAQASFLASVALFPLGVAAVGTTWNQDRRELLPLAATPLFFSLQQACEGFVWRWIEGPPLPSPEAAPLPVVAASLAYLFFAYAFWPVWMPLTAVALHPRNEPGNAEAGMAKVWHALPWLGLLPGLWLWLPLLGDPRSAVPVPVAHSLVYTLGPWSAEALPPNLGPALYAALIVIPLLVVPCRRVRVFAVTLLLAFGFTQWATRHALTSVWCFASALLSAQVFWILQRQPLSPPVGALREIG